MLPRLRPGERLLRPIFPNAGTEAAYRAQLRKLIKSMHDASLKQIKLAYRENPPALAQDTAAEALAQVVTNLRSIWHGLFDEAARKLAEYFGQEMVERSDSQLRSILRDAGISVKFQMTPAMKDVLGATVAANVGLIRSIPTQYLDKVEQAVMRSVQKGRDLKRLTQEIEDIYPVTRKRAELIAIDQNNKATTFLSRARRLELGIGEAVWMHSHAGKEPRPAHVAMDGKRFSLEEGMWDSYEQAWVQPGELINCRCSSRPIIKGLGG